MLQTKIEDLRSKFYSELKSPKRVVHLNSFKSANPIATCKQWIENKQKEVNNCHYPSDIDQIERELLKQNEILKQIDEFKAKINEAKSFISKNQHDKNIEDYKHDLNEIEISLNLLYVSSSIILKNLILFIFVTKHRTF